MRACACVSACACMACMCVLRFCPVLRACVSAHHVCLLALISILVDWRAATTPPCRRQRPTDTARGAAKPWCRGAHRQRGAVPRQPHRLCCSAGISPNLLNSFLVLLSAPALIMMRKQRRTWCEGRLYWKVLRQPHHYPKCCGLASPSVNL